MNTNSTFDKYTAVHEATIINSLLVKANQSYGDGESKMDDSTYDCYWRRLQFLINEIKLHYPEYILEDNILDTVGYTKLKTKHFESVKHESHMGSLDNCFTVQEFESFLTKIKNEGIVVNEFVSEFKYDGFGLSLIYKHGMLTQAITRGDGYVGENIIANVKHLGNISYYVKRFAKKETVEIRGEVILSLSNFSLLNEYRKQKGEKLYANPRNAVAGIMRSLDYEDLPIKIEFKPYELVNGIQFFDKINTTLIEPNIKQTDVLGLLYTNVLSVKPTNLNYICWQLVDEGKIDAYSSSIHELYNSKTLLVNRNYFQTIMTDHIMKMTHEREALDFEIDGIVIKVNDLTIANTLGRTSRVPLSAIAWKFPPKKALGQLLSVTWQVGRTGIITPVAEVTPTYVGGVVVTRVTLHNPAEIERLGIQLKDMVEIERRGDVIPKITGYSKEWRDKTKNVYKDESLFVVLPKECPCCNNLLSLIENIKTNTKELRCYNASCKDQLVHSIIHFASREAMRIEGLGESVAYDLVYKGLVDNFDDIYTLTKEKLLTIEGFADKSSDNLLEAIANSRTVDLDRFIYALGIPELGRTTSKVLAKAFDWNLMDIANASYEDLLNVKDIGPITAKSINVWFGKNYRLVKDLINSSVITISSPEIAVTNATSKIFVITGSFYNDVTNEKVSREELTTLLEKVGITVTNKVTSKTTALILGDNPGISKLADATKHGVKLYEINKENGISLSSFLSTFT